MFYVKNQFKSIYFMALLVILSVFSCKKEEETEQENLTRIEVHLVGINGSSFNKEFEWKDTNADKIADAIDTISIPANTSFKVHVHVYDDTKTPSVEVSDEIEAESNVHLFIFKPNTNGLTISDLSKDAAGQPFGIDSVWKTTAAANGSVRILLHHEPTDKNSATPGGEVDFDVSFPVKVE
jgi:hypothetical protein